jgi:hypothetical protein
MLHAFSLVLIVFGEIKVHTPKANEFSALRLGLFSLGTMLVPSRTRQAMFSWLSSSRLFSGRTLTETHTFSLPSDIFCSDERKSALHCSQIHLLGQFPVVLWVNRTSQVSPASKNKKQNVEIQNV